MCIRRRFLVLAERTLSLLTCMPKSQRILLNYGIYECVMSLLGVPLPVPSNVGDPRVVYAFEEFCHDNLEHDVNDILDESKDLDTLVDQHMVTLQIDTRYRHLFQDAVLQMRKKACDIRQLNGIASIRVDGNDETHCKLMHEVWRSLDDRNLPESFLVTKSIGKEDVKLSSWGDLGFQTPLTDFRMTGLLGLKAMHYMVTNHKEESRTALRLSHKLEAWFPFAITSINVTSWLLEDFRTHKLAVLSYSNDIPTQEMFYILHTFYFFSFVRYWELSGVESILEFKEVSHKFRDYVLHALEEMTHSILNRKVLGDNKFCSSELLRNLDQRIC